MGEIGEAADSEVKSVPKSSKVSKMEAGEKSEYDCWKNVSSPDHGNAVDFVPRCGVRGLAPVP